MSIFSFRRPYKYIYYFYGKTIKESREEKKKTEKQCVLCRLLSLVRVRFISQICEFSLTNWYQANGECDGSNAATTTNGDKI